MERCIRQIVLKETLKMSAKKLRCRLRNRGIKLISKRSLACKLAVVILNT
jgi:hypothetical protein